MHRVRVPAGILAIVFGLLLLPSMASALKMTPSTGSPLASESAAQGVSAADFNGDGRSDLAIANGQSAPNGILIRLGAADGTFTSTTPSSLTK